MRHFAGDSAESYAVGVVDVARWEQFGLGGTLPFQAMWYTVPPESSSPTDCHPELELSVVVGGAAAVEAGGRITEVPQGDCFLLDSSEPHVIHNRSADVPLRIFTTFWMPRDGGAPDDGSPEDRATEDRATEDRATEDRATEDRATEDGATPAAAGEAR